MGQSVTSIWMVVWWMPKWSRSWWLRRSRTASVSVKRHLDDLNVAGEGVALAGEAPDVEVVDVDDAIDALHR